MADDLYDDYVAMGIIDPEDDDTFPCAQCGFTIMPWWLRCEACGTTEYRQTAEAD